MLSHAPREGASVRTRAGVRAFVLTLAFAGSLAAAPAAPPPAASTPASTAAAPAPASVVDPDSTLQRLAEEVAKTDLTSPEALTRLQAVLRDLIDIERATRRELAALRAEVAALRNAGARRVSSPALRPRSASTPPSSAGHSPAAGGASAVKSPSASAVTTTAAGPLFGKRGLKKVHRPGCSFGERIRAEDRVSFGTMQDATTAGYEACKSCRPE